MRHGSLSKMQTLQDFEETKTKLGKNLGKTKMHRKIQKKTPRNQRTKVQMEEKKPKTQNQPSKIRSTTLKAIESKQKQNKRWKIKNKSR